MKKSFTVVRWVGVALFALMALYALSEGGFLGALFFFLGGAIITPLEPIKKLRGKLKLNKTISIILAVALLIVGSLVTPTPEAEDNLGSGVVTTGSADSQEEPNDTSGDATENSTDGLTDAKDETTEAPSDTTKDDNTTASDETTNSQAGVGLGSAKPVSLSSIPAYSGSPYVVVSNNIPNFSAAELKTTGYEKYSDLDSLGRTGTALACVGKDTMPAEGEERGDISSIKPTGWVQAKYDNVSGGWLYNRCHLIGWQLSAENANKKNLLTGTKYLNNTGMLPFENIVADYIEETGNHVAYRITPIYDGNNLLASGVQMEAYSVEDQGEGIQFNVFCYNVQPGITINYKDGSSSANVVVEPEDTSAENTQQDTSSKTVYITATGKKYHSTKYCSGLSNANAIYESTLSEAEEAGLGPCSKCH